MKKKLNRAIVLVLIALLVLSCFACKKKQKHKWMEKGAPEYVPVAPGVHPERGTASDAVPVYTLSIYYPIGRDERARRKYEKYLYESEENTPAAVDIALKNIGLIDEVSEFCDLVVEDSDEVLNAGPGASDSQLTKKGKIRYYDLAPADGVVNTDKYEYGKDQKGMIDDADVIHCIKKSFEETFQLVSCDIVLVDKKTGKELTEEDLAEEEMEYEESENE